MEGRDPTALKRRIEPGLSRYGGFLLLVTLGLSFASQTTTGASCPEQTKQ
jgi:hypothetical protein